MALYDLSEGVLPSRKPSDVIAQTSSNPVGGFIDSLFSNAKGLSQDAFETSFNILRIKQLFDNQDKILIEDPNVINQAAPAGQSALAADPLSSINPNVIGLALGAVGLFILFGDND